MGQIIKAQSYQMVRSRLVKAVYLCVALLMIFSALIDIFEIEGLQQIRVSASYVLMNDDGITFISSVLFVGFIAAESIGSDFKDKDLYYELLSGRGRAASFFARSIYTVLVTAFVSVIAAFIPMVFCLLLRGWGEQAELSGVIIRQLLYFFPFVRITSFVVLVIYITRNPYVGMMLGYVIALAGTLVGALIKSPSAYLTGFHNLEKLSNYKPLGVESGQQITPFTVFETAVPVSLIAGTIAASLAVAALYLIIGYLYHRRKDLN